MTPSNEPRPPPKPPPKPSRVEEARAVVEEDIAQLRELIRKLKRRLLH